MRRATPASTKPCCRCPLNPDVTASHASRPWPPLHLRAPQSPWPRSPAPARSPATSTPETGGAFLRSKRAPGVENHVHIFLENVPSAPEYLPAAGAVGEAANTPR